MARVYLVSQGVIRVCYSVDGAVGVGGTNNRDDVLLVQFFLSVISQKDAAYVPPGEPPLKIDGSCGPSTLKFIRQFQKVNSDRNPGSPLTSDGRVDPIKRGVAVGSIGGRVLTMAALNIVYKNSRSVALHDNITKDPAFPGELKPAIALN